jgi:hypothetical protein
MGNLGLSLNCCSGNDPTYDIGKYDFDVDEFKSVRR